VTTNRPSRYVTALISALAAVAAVSGILLWSRYHEGPSREIVISLPPTEETAGSIYVGGAVNNPSLYPFIDGDSLDSVIRAAGGLTAGADLSAVQLYIPQDGEESHQKIDINRAEAWLLQALPGIGETRAADIVAYRQQSGAFRSTDELMKVDGIGTATYQQIEGLVTVADQSR